MRFILFHFFYAHNIFLKKIGKSNSKNSFPFWSNGLAAMSDIKMTCLSSSLVDHNGTEANPPLHFARNKILFQIQAAIKISNAPLNS